MLYDTIPKWQKEILWPLGLDCIGVIIFIYTATYDSKYSGDIDENDRDDNMYNNSKFYSIEDPIISTEHRIALENI